MYAVIETGGKQYRVIEGQTLPVERLAGEPNSAFVFDRVLLVSDGEAVTIGQPYLKGVSVAATIVEEKKDAKVIIRKFKPKTGYNRTRGHRQIYTLVKIEKINK
jgi:large subunit ribosomal protein L21